MALKKKGKKGSSLDMPDKVKQQIANAELIARGRSDAPTDLNTLKEQIGAVDPADLDPAETRREINNRNRKRGKSAEREIARLLGGEVVAGSGAIKNSNKNLLMDVQVRDALNQRDIIAVEVKSTAAISAKGERSFNLKKSVLDQAFSEADKMEMIGLLWVHWVNLRYGTDDYQIWRSEDSVRIIDFARWGYLLAGLVDDYGLTREEIIDLVERAAQEKRTA